MEQSMEEEYGYQLQRLKNVVLLLNPLQEIMGEEGVRDLVCEPNVEMLDLSLDQKSGIKKIYKSWLRVNHPDKWDAGETRELSLQLCKMYGDVFIRVDEKEFDKVWMFMGYSALTFNRIDVDVLTLDDVSRLIRDSFILLDMVRQFTDVGIQIEGVAQNLKDVLSKIKIYLKAIEDGFCTSHSTSTVRFLRRDCAKCCEATVAGQGTYSEVDSSVDEEENNVLVCDDSEGKSDTVDFQAGDDENEHSDSDDHYTTREKKLKESIKMELKSLNVKTLMAIAASKDLNTHNCLEKTELIKLIVEHDLEDEEMRRVRNHKKREKPTKYSVPIHTWQSCEIVLVDRLPYDINKLVVYKMTFDPHDKMRRTGWTKMADLGDVIKKGIHGNKALG